jgi:hypothetical protein
MTIPGQQTTSHPALAWRPALGAIVIGRSVTPVLCEKGMPFWQPPPKTAARDQSLTID